MSHKLYNVGAYIRLSREDNRPDESLSVENQRTMLSQFISHMPNWIETRIYIDDGASGSNFNRRGFQDMMEDVRSGKINLVLVKDLSRFGRNYLEAGRYLEEELPALGCRFVALSDNIDTEGGENDIMPFLNAINDFYVRDVSERIKSVIKAKAKDGQKITGAAPYGYIREPDEHAKIVVDEIASKIINRIFEMRANGMGYTAIAAVLNEDGILSPRAYYFTRQNRKNNAKDKSTASCANFWAARTVKLILNNEIYIGNLMSLKRGTRSHRDGRVYQRDKSEWIRVDNTHTPIVEAGLWDKVQKVNLIAKERMENCKPRRPNRYTGILVCPDCGAKMNRIKKTYYCSAYQRSGKTICHSHRIMESDLDDIVLSHIKGLAAQITLNEDAMLENLRAMLVKGYKNGKKGMVKQKQIMEKQLYALEQRIDQLYEDKVSGVISAESFIALVGKLENKRADVESALIDFNEATQKAKTKLADINKWVSLIKEKSSSIEVDRELIEVLIEKIEVGEKSEVNGQQHQDVRIFYKIVGNCLCYL